jgi:hypothetical protein
MKFSNHQALTDEKRLQRLLYLVDYMRVLHQFWEYEDNCLKQRALA